MHYTTMHSNQSYFYPSPAQPANTELQAHHSHPPCSTHFPKLFPICRDLPADPAAPSSQRPGAARKRKVVRWRPGKGGRQDPMRCNSMPGTMTSLHKGPLSICVSKTPETPQTRTQHVFIFHDQHTFSSSVSSVFFVK